jgi:hypothetical protein
MKQKISHVLYALCITLFAVFNVFAQVSLTGTVIDGQGNPISGAKVKLAVAGDSTTTNDQGVFSLGTTNIKMNLLKNNSISPLTLGNYIYFSVSKNIDKVTINIFDITGKHIAKVLEKNLSAGNYSVYPFSNNLSAKTYIVNLTIGNNSFNFTMNYIEGSNQSVVVKNISNSQIKNILAKRSEIIDTLIVSKTGYLTNKKPLEVLSGNHIIVLQKFVPAQELGIISERVTNQLNWANVNVYVWDQGTPGTALNLSYTGDKQEGTKCGLVTVGSAGWSGWGIAPKATDGVDMSGYAGGKLRFYIKGNCPSVAVMVTWNVQNAAQKLDLANYGYVPDDGQWHLIEIPLTAFGDIVLTNITYYVSFLAPAATGGLYTAGSTYMIDDLTWVPAQ